jgi:single-strand DNA-binding protein
MSSLNINRVVLLGNLTADPDLRQTNSGTSVCKLRLACTTRHKDAASGEWVERPNYFDVTIWGSQGEKAARYLQRGAPVAVDGRLQWREWEASDGSKRQGVQIIAQALQYLGAREPDTPGPQVQPDLLEEVAAS